MRIAGLQLNVAWEERTANYTRVRDSARRSADSGADILVLPEMFATGFSMNLDITAESLDGETTTFIRSIAKEFRLAVVGGLVLRSESGLGRNLAVAVDNEGRDLSAYCKSHLVSLLQEDRYHERGDGPQPFDLGDMRCACFICYDLRFPELFRLVAEQCHVVMVIASWPRDRQIHWDVLLRARAIENQLYVIGVNRVGQGGGLSFDGGSAIYDPMGELLAHGGQSERLIFADIAPDEVFKARKTLPFLKDRRF